MRVALRKYSLPLYRRGANQERPLYRRSANLELPIVVSTMLYTYFPAVGGDYSPSSALVFIISAACSLRFASCSGDKVAR